MDAGGWRSHNSQGSGSPGALRSTRVRAPDRVGGSRSAETALAEAMPDTVSRPSTNLTELRWLAAPLLSDAPKPTPARELCHVPMLQPSAERSPSGPEDPLRTRRRGS